MVVSGPLNAPAAFGGRAPESVWTRWRRENEIPLPLQVIELWCSSP